MWWAFMAGCVAGILATLFVLQLRAATKLEYRPEDFVYLVGPRGIVRLSDHKRVLPPSHVPGVLPRHESKGNSTGTGE